MEERTFQNTVFSPIRSCLLSMLITPSRHIRWIGLYFRLQLHNTHDILSSTCQLTRPGDSDTPYSPRINKHWQHRKLFLLLRLFSKYMFDRYVEYAGNVF